MKKSAFDLNFQNLSIDSKIIASLERIAQIFRVLLWEESKEFALSPIQVQVLIFVLFHSEEKRKVSYLASEFNMTKATISDAIKSLEQKQLIEKEYELHDTRSYVIHLTSKGRDIAHKTSLFTSQLQIPIEKLPDPDKGSLLSSLLDIIKHLHGAGLISTQRMCLSCRFYKAGQGKQDHYCHLLDQTLTSNELRVDCLEHQLVN